MRVDKKAGLKARHYTQGRTKVIVISNWAAAGFKPLVQAIQVELCRGGFQIDTSLNACPLTVTTNKNLLTITQTDQDGLHFHYLRFHRRRRHAVAKLIAVKAIERHVEAQILSEQQTNNEALVKICQE